jgi:hypothetical protein
LISDSEDKAAAVAHSEIAFFVLSGIAAVGVQSVKTVEE